jgi:hypothetical protein
MESNAEIVSERQAGSYAADELDAISERIVDMTAADTGNIVCPTNLHTRALQPFHQGVVIATAQSRVRLLCRTKIILHAQVNLNAAALEPASSTFSEFGRFRDLRQAQQAAIELASGVFAACRHGELDVIDYSEWRMGHGKCLVRRGSRLS